MVTTYNRELSLQHSLIVMNFHLHAIKLLHNAMGMEGVYRSVNISITKVYSPTLFGLQGGGDLKFPDKRVTYHLNGPFSSSELRDGCER